MSDAEVAGAKRSCSENRRERPSRIGVPLPTVDRTRHLRSSRPMSLEPRRLRPFAWDGSRLRWESRSRRRKKDAAVLGTPVCLSGICCAS